MFGFICPFFSDFNQKIGDDNIGDGCDQGVACKIGGRGWIPGHCEVKQQHEDKVTDEQNKTIIKKGTVMLIR